jgi:hypothetical protein
MAQGVFMFHTIFRISCDCFPKQHSLDMDGIFCEVGAGYKHNLDKTVVFKGLKAKGMCIWKIYIGPLHCIASFHRCYCAIINDISANFLFPVIL